MEQSREETFIQIGVTAMRAPDGSFLPSVPLYAKVPVTDIDPQSGLYVGEEKALRDVGKVFADKFREYVNGGGVVPRSRKATTKQRPPQPEQSEEATP